MCYNTEKFFNSEGHIMNYFLIDYENVHVNGLNGISKLTENDVVIIFYSENADTLTFGMHRRINESKADIQFQRVDVKEKNALDFQLCTYLGFLIHEKMSEENFYYIVSNDGGYAVLPNYCKKFGIDLKLVSDLTKNEVQFIPKKSDAESTPTATKNNLTELKMALRKILKTDAEIDEAVKIIQSSKTKTDVNSNLGKKFKDRGGKIYQAVKEFISDKKSS